MLGQTRLTVAHTGVGPANQLNARLYDLYPDGKQVMVDRGVKRIVSPLGPTTLDLHGAGCPLAGGHPPRALRALARLLSQDRVLVGVGRGAAAEHHEWMGVAEVA